MPCSSDIHSFCSSAYNSVRSCCSCAVKSVQCRTHVRGHLNYLGYFLSNLETFIILTFVVFIGFILAMMVIKENWQEERQGSQSHSTGCVCHWACGPELICTKIICFFERIFKKISPFRNS